MIGFQNPTGNVFYRVNEGSVLEQELTALGWQKVSPDLANEDKYLAVPELSQIDMFIQTSAKYDDLVRILEMLKNAGLGDPESSNVGPEALAARATYPEGDSASGSSTLSDLTVRQLQPIAQSLGISTTGLNKAALIEEIEYAQQNQQNEE